MAIKSFKDEYSFLSNFYPCLGSSVEHLYQAAKTVDPDEVKIILAAKTPGQAKRLGRDATLVDNWNDIKIPVMTRLLWAKFSKEPFRTLLLDTGDEYLEEGNTWGDREWGVYNGSGHNKLGVLLMAIRAIIKLQANKIGE